MKYAAVFLNGTYPAESLDFYAAVIDKASGRGLVVAVDGALNLFHRLRRTPSCVLGDFDSVDQRVLEQFPNVERIEYPRDKDATDGELGVRYVLEQGCDLVEIFGAIDSRFESDQMLSNIFLLAATHDHAEAAGRKIKARLVDHRQYVYFLDNSRLDLAGNIGDLLSIVPLSRKVRITLTGTQWELRDQEAKFGSTWTVRNCLAQPQATIEVRGRAVVIHRHT